MRREDVIVSSEAVEATIDAFTQLDESGNKTAMNKMARRLGKEQPALLQYAASIRDAEGEMHGEAAVFYGTLVWAMFDRGFGKRLPTLTNDNIEAALEVVDAAVAGIEGYADKPLAERCPDEMRALQPNIHAKLGELLHEDVAEEVITSECAESILRPTQAVVEAFDAAIEGRRPGERRGPVVRETPKVGRNEPCPCGSGKKYKRCHGQA
nr:SEC-C metal-binding domain-containing protein [Haliangium ochraceum]